MVDSLQTVLLPTDVYEALLLQTCSIVRNTGSAKDANGQTIPVWATIATGVPCWIQADESREMLKTTGAQVPKKFTAFMKAGADIAEKDRVTQNDDEFQVKGVLMPGSVMHHLEVELLRVTQGGV